MSADAVTDKAEDADADVSAEIDRETISTSQREENPEPAAGPTDKMPGSNMDTDDDFMSDGGSSVEHILDTQGSDDESMDEG